MTTITGKIENATDLPLRVLVSFAPKTAPFIQATGIVIAKDAIQLFSNANDGGFSVALEAGVYNVNYAANPPFNFDITVPSTGGPYTIDQVAALPPPSPVYTPSGSGSPEGVVTAPPGSPYVDTTGNCLYIKMFGTGNTGWQAFVQL